MASTRGKVVAAEAGGKVATERARVKAHFLVVILAKIKVQPTGQGGKRVPKAAAVLARTNPEAAPQGDRLMLRSLQPLHHHQHQRIQ